MREKEQTYQPVYTYILLAALISIPVCSRAQFSSTISAFFPKSWEGKQAMVVAKPLYGPPVIDTTTIGNRTATFTINLVEPSPAYLWVEGNQEDVHFFIDSPKINVALDPEAFSQPLITGSASSEVWAMQRDLDNHIRESRPDLRTERFAALQTGDSLGALSLEELIDSLQIIDDNQLIKHIGTYPALASSWYLFASTYLPYSQTARLFDKLGAFASYPSYQKIKEKLARQKPGNKSPDFSLKTPSGTTITLSTITSSYILLDFTISHMVLDRKRQVDLKKLYAKYHPAGLEIVTVSFEFNKKDSDESFAKYRLPWIQVADIMGPSSTMEAFDIDKMSDNILLDSNKRIIDRGLTIRELEQTLEKLLKK